MTILDNANISNIVVTYPLIGHWKKMVFEVVLLVLPNTFDLLVSDLVKKNSFPIPSSKYSSVSDALSKNENKIKAGHVSLQY